MALPQAFSSVTSLMGGLRINYALGMAGTEDIGGKVATLISQITILQTNVALIQSAIVSAAASAITFSAVSTVPGATYFTTMASVTNFTST